MNDFVKVILMSMLPSAAIGFGVWIIKRAIEKSETKRLAVEECREEHQIILLTSINASIALGEATAIAIRDQKCNGEVSAALEYAKQVKNAQREFYQKQGIKKII